MVKLAQRYAKAVGSGNLKADEYHFDTDVLAAMALSSTFGGLLFRVKYFNDAVAYKRLLDQWTWIVSTKAIRRNWPDNVADSLDKIASLSLNRWLNDVCPVCTGRRQETIFNTGRLSDKLCKVCEGSGQAPLRCHSRLRDYVLDMVEELTEAERKAGRRAIKKLGKEDQPAA